MFTYAVHGSAQNGVVFMSFLLGGCGVGLVWLIYYLTTMNREDAHLKWAGGIFYSTQRSHRISGQVGERVAEGHWITWIKSLWKTYDGHFFILRIDELHPPTLTPVTREFAEQFIKICADDQTARKLIQEWLKE